jgi:hypothetical protein
LQSQLEAGSRDLTGADPDHWFRPVPSRSPQAGLSFLVFSGLSVQTYRFNMEIIDRVCREMDCQPGDILEYVPE